MSVSYGLARYCIMKAPQSGMSLLDKLTYMFFGFLQLSVKKLCQNKNKNNVKPTQLSCLEN